MGYYLTLSNSSVARYNLPLRKGFGKFQHRSISKEAEMRLKWMDYISSGKTVAQTARHFDYPYSTVKFWHDRYNKYNLNSLDNHSSRPRNVRRPELRREQKVLIIQARRYDLPGAGKKTLQRFIQNEYNITVGQSSIQRVINEAGLKRERKIDKRKVKYKKNRNHMYTVPKKVMVRPGGLVYLDVKHLRIGLKKYYQFTALDHATRIMKAKLYKSITSESTVKFLEYIKQEVPFKRIEYLGTDNGSEFLGKLEEYLNQKRIKHVFSSPASPRQNPFVERVIRTIIDEVYKPFGLEETAELHQEGLDEYLIRYNTKRPHQGINLLTPIQMYAKLLTSNSIT